MYLNPDHMTTEEQNAVAAWLERNGCRHYIALEPIVIRGNVVEYTAFSRKDHKSLMRQPVRDYEIACLGRRRIRVRDRHWTV